MKQIDRKPRILLACKNRRRGGGQEKHFIQIARYLSKDYQLAFLMAGGYIEPDMPELGRIYQFPGRGKWLFSPLDLVYMVYVILHERSDIIHTHQRYPAFLGRLITGILGRKLLCTVHNAFPDKSGISLWGDHMIAVSHGVESWLVNKCHQSRDRITVIHNGIAPPRVWPESELDSLRNGLGIPHDVKILLTAGRLSEQKNHAAMLRILAMLDSEGWVCLLAGEGEGKQALEKQAHQFGLQDKVRFLGFRSDVDGLMQLADIYLMTSAWEGLPYVLVEAIASGLPAVVTRVGGVAEAISDGENGFIVEAGDERAFAGKLELLMGDEQLRHDFANAGMKRFQDQFLDQAMFDSIERVYASLLGS